MTDKKSPSFKDFPHPPTQAELDSAVEFMKNHKVAIFVVAYQAEKYIEQLLERIPGPLLSLFAEIYIIDDYSRDRTFQVARKARSKYEKPEINIYRTPFNRGYGGNQKLGYLYGIEHDHDVVVLLHGDGQYPPEFLARVIAPFNDDDTDAVFASRMITKDYAHKKGGMPTYKWWGNQILTKFENFVLGTNLSEFHTGYRAYRTRILKQIPFKYNNDGFHFDTEIIIQVNAAGGKIAEVAIPTHYGDEICHVNGIQYAWNCVKSVIWYRLTRYGIFFDRRYDVNLFEGKDYTYKRAPNSLHQWLLNRRWHEGLKVIDLFPGSGKFSSKLAERGPEVYAVSKGELSHMENVDVISADISEPFADKVGRYKYDSAIMLNGLQHYRNVGDMCEEISKIVKPGGALYVCTGNVVYFPVRFFFLFGAFHYGKRGILDLSHTRLFTRRALVRLLVNSGFKINNIRGFGPPLRDMIRNSWFIKKIDLFLSFLARLYPSLFAYQILVEAEKLDDVESILERTISSDAEAESKKTVSPEASPSGTDS